MLSTVPLPLLLHRDRAAVNERCPVVFRVLFFCFGIVCRVFCIDKTYKRREALRKNAMTNDVTNVTDVSIIWTTVRCRRETGHMVGCSIPGAPEYSHPIIVFEFTKTHIKVCFKWKGGVH